jgi:protein TonB
VHRVGRNRIPLTRDIGEAPRPTPIPVPIVTGAERRASPALATEASLIPSSQEPEPRALDPVMTAPVHQVEPHLAPVAPSPPLAAASPTRTLHPALPETPMPELIEVATEAQSVRPPLSLVQPARPPSPSPLSPQMTPLPAPSPPVSIPPVRPHPSQTAPARETPQRTAPSTAFNDTLIAGAPSGAAQRQDRMASAAPGSRAAEGTPPRPSLPQSSGVRYGQNPTPAYPFLARQQGWEGTVLLLVEIRENGRPDRITIKQSSGHSVLDEAAKGAVGRWTFIPAQQDGKPLRSLAEVPIVFSLRHGR